MTGDKVISALVGLVGAVANNGRTKQTDEVIGEAFLHLREPDREEDMVRQIHAAKNVIAPDCAVCKNPCPEAFAPYPSRPASTRNTPLPWNSSAWRKKGTMKRPPSS